MQPIFWLVLIVLVSYTHLRMIGEIDPLPFEMVAMHFHQMYGKHISIICGIYDAALNAIPFTDELLRLPNPNQLYTRLYTQAVGCLCQVFSYSGQGIWIFRFI